MTEFEPRISGIESDLATCVKTTAPEEGQV